MLIINKKILFSFLFILTLLINGCGYMLAPKYDQPIYTFKRPYVSVRQTYGEIHIITPVQLVNASPDYFDLQVIKTSDNSPIISGIQYMVGKPIEVYLPQNSLSLDVNGNTLILTPIGRNYSPIVFKFAGIRYGEIVLPHTVINKRPAIVSGLVSKRFDGEPLAHFPVAIIDSLGNKFSEYTNMYGEYEIKMPNEYFYYNNLKIVSGEGSPFHVSQNNIDFKGSFSTVSDILVGPSKQFMEEGNFYIVQNDLTHYRKEPFNGSETQFLLSMNELVAVSRVAGNRLLGQVEVFYETHKSVNITGWVNAKDVIWIGDINLYLSGYGDEIQ